MKNKKIFDYRETEKYIYLLDEVAREFENSGEEPEDLKQAGYIGLINALNIYKKNENETAFLENARILIAGEIRNFIRDKYDKIKIPAWIKLMNKLINQFVIRYYRQFRKFPDLAKISQMLKISPEGLKEILKARDAVHTVSIDKKRREKDITDYPNIKKIKKELKKNDYEPGNY